jgi:cyanophycin synthetase
VQIKKLDISPLKDYPLAEGPLKIEDIKILWGANYFSGGPVIRFRLNLKEYDEVFTNEIPGFYEKLKKKLPSLHEHHCSPGVPGGFFQRVKEGTLLGHVMEHVAIELQTLAGIDVGFGKTRMTKKQGVYNVVFRFFDAFAGIYAGKASFNLITALLNDQDFNVGDVIENLIIIRAKRMLGFSTQAIVDEAIEREIPYLRLNKYNLVQLGTGRYKKIIRATITGNTSLISVETTDNKYKTTQVLSEFGVPVPKRSLTEDLEEILAFKDKLNGPIVLKPLTGYQGKRVSINLNTKEQITSAFQFVKEFDEQVVVQEYIPGNAYRVLVIDNKAVAAVQLLPAIIVGDGKLSVNQLIEILNSDPEREIGDKGKLSRYSIDEDTLKILELIGHNLESVPEKGEKIYLRNSGNIRLGGKSIDVTDKMDPYNAFICERISKLLNLDVAGIDIISEDISIPVIKNNGKVIEVNAAPDFKMHIKPYEGDGIPVQNHFLDMLFPVDEPNHVPIFSITGSKGKTIVSGLLQSCLIKKNHICGIVSKKGLFVNDKCLNELDATDKKSTELILRDPSIDCAIVESPVETILNSGIGYKYADFGIVLNLDDDNEKYYEYDHVRDIVDIAYAKSVVAEEVYDNGYSILNADDELILEMTERLYSKPVLFSLDYQNEALREHVDNGGTAAVIDDQRIVVLDGSDRVEVLFINEIPFLTGEETVEDFLVQSVLASVAALYLFNCTIDEIRETLLSYKPDNNED